jgi:hypothetical protein
MVSVAERLPLRVGAKVTLIVQLAPVATEVPQLFVWLKSPALLPLMDIPEMDRTAVPLFVNIAVCGALVVPTFCFAKFRLVGESFTAGAMPVPLRLTVCGLPVALSVMLSVPVSVPVAVGVNVTLIVQAVATASEVPQLFDSP